jgi:excisionase family DNA binding protein
MENPFESLEKRLESIERKLDNLLQQRNNVDDNLEIHPKWLSTKQLAEYLGMSTSAITNMRGSKLPYYKVGGRIMFKKQEIDEYILSTRHKSGSEHLEDYLNSPLGRSRLSHLKH